MRKAILFGQIRTFWHFLGAIFDLFPAFLGLKFMVLNTPFNQMKKPEYVNVSDVIAGPHGVVVVGGLLVVPLKVVKPLTEKIPLVS